MNWSFNDKVALVTGAGSGMGLATARAFAEAGAAVALADGQANAVRSAAEELISAGHKTIAIRCNVADEAEVAAMVEQTVSSFGRLDAAYNNAGVQCPAVETADARAEEFDRVNAINLRGVWNCMKYQLRQMREQGSGAIVNCSSIGGLIGIAGRAMYHASKHGVIGLTKSAAATPHAEGRKPRHARPVTEADKGAQLVYLGGHQGEREMWPRLPLLIVIPSAAIVLAVLYVTYRLVDPLPPRHLAIAAGMAGSGYDNFARQYARILSRHGVELEIRNTAGAVEDLDQLRDPASGVQAALTTFGITQPADADTLYSLGGIFDAAIFIFYKNAEPITLFAQFRGKRLSIGMPGTALRSLMLEVLKATDALDVSTHLFDQDYTQAIDALIAGEIDVAIFPQQDVSALQRALGAPGIRIMSVVQAEAIAKTVPGLKHVVLWRGLISLSRDIPNSDVDLLASRNRLLVRKDLHPALQYLLLEAMREVHWPAGPFNRLGEFPAEQPNDLPLSPTAEAFYRSGPTFWQRYTSFWLTSLLSRIVFFVIPVVAAMIPVIGFALPFYRWLRIRRIDQLHRALGNLERELAQSADKSRFAEYQKRIAEIESAVRLLKVARPFEADLHRLRIHLRMVEEDINRLSAVIDGATNQGAAGTSMAHF